MYLQLEWFYESQMLYIKSKFLSYMYVRHVHSCVHACRRNKEIYPSIVYTH